jgi:regulator of replication initiation timing
MGDRFTMSGDFRGSIVNIKSTLTDVKQSVGEIPTEDEAVKKALTSLISQLQETLEKTPQEKQEQAEAVAQSAQALVEQAKAEKPNRTLLKISAEGLKQAAQNLADVMPAVVGIAAQIALAVNKATGTMGS